MKGYGTSNSLKDELIREYSKKFNEERNNYSDLYRQYFVTVKLPIKDIKVDLKILKEILNLSILKLESIYFNIKEKKIKSGKPYPVFPKISVIGNEKTKLNHYHILIFLPKNCNLINVFSEIFIKNSKDHFKIDIKEEDIINYFHFQDYSKFDDISKFTNYTNREENPDEFRDSSTADLYKIDLDLLNFSGIENEKSFKGDRFELHKKCNDFYIGNLSSEGEVNSNNINFKPYLNNGKKTTLRKLQGNRKLAMIEGSRAHLLSEISNAFISDDKVTLINSFVGSGKSEAIKSIDMREFPNKRFLIAFPKHRNIDDFLKNSPVNQNDYNLHSIAKKTPDYSENLKSIINNLYKNNLNPIDNLKGTEYNEYIDHLINKNLIIEKSQVVLTTHETLLNLENLNQFDYILIDEDISSSMLKEKSLTFDTLKNFIVKKWEIIYEESEEDAQIISNFINFLNDSKNSFLIKEFNFEDIERLSYICECFDETNYDNYPIDLILLFLKCNYFYIDSNKNIKFIQERKINFDKKIIIFTATYISEFYNKLFDKVKYIEITKSIMKAKIYQYISSDYTRRKIKNNEYLMQEVEMLIEYHKSREFNTISYSEFNVNENIYTANGINSLKGNNLCVLGIPFIPPNYFKLVLLNLGINFTPLDKAKIETYILNDYEFTSFGFYKESEINHIYLSMTNNILIQAIGRARPYEYESIICVYTSIPQENALIYSDYSTIFTLLTESDLKSKIEKVPKSIKKSIKRNNKKKKNELLFIAKKNHPHYREDGFDVAFKINDNEEFIYKYYIDYIGKDRKYNKTYINYKIGNYVFEEKKWINNQNIKDKTILYEQSVITEKIKNNSIDNLIIFSDPLFCKVINYYYEKENIRSFATSFLNLKLNRSSSEIKFLLRTPKNIRKIIIPYNNEINIIKCLNLYKLFRNREDFLLADPTKEFYNFNYYKSNIEILNRMSGYRFNNFTNDINCLKRNFKLCNRYRFKLKIYERIYDFYNYKNLWTYDFFKQNMNNFDENIFLEFLLNEFNSYNSNFHNSKINIKLENFKRISNITYHKTIRNTYHVINPIYENEFSLLT
jgi:hypothetical protein